MKKILYTLLGMMLSVGAWAQTSLQAQINGAEAGETITLSANEELTSTVTIAKSITLNLNGHNITGTGARALQITNGAVTITGTGTITSTGIADNSSVIRVGDNTTTSNPSLAIDENVTVESDCSYGVTIFGKNASETLVVNGTVKTTSVMASAISGNGSAGYCATTITIGENANISAENDVAIYQPQAGTLTVNGTVSGLGGIEIKAGSLTVGANAKISATGTLSHNANSDGTSTRGYAISIVENTKYKGVSAVTVSPAAVISGPIATLVDSEKDDFNPTLEGITMVAEVGEVKYSKLAEAVAAATADQTITLIANTTENITIPAGKNITLDLNGKTLSGGSVATNGKKAAIVNNGTIVVLDSSAEQTGTIKREDDDTGLSASNSYYVIDNHGTMTIKSGNIINNSGLTTAHKGSSLIRNGEPEAAVLNIEGGTLTQNNFDVIKNGGKGTLNISGGTINSSNSYAVLSYSEMNMTAGTVNGNVCLRSYTDSEEDTHGVGNISGGTINGNITVETYTGNTPNTLSECNISGTAVINGTLSVGEGNGNTFTANDEKGTIAVSGGTFSSAVPEGYCADGFIPQDNGDGTYGVKEGSYVAKIGEQGYETLAEAIAAATAGQTITLLADVEIETIGVVSGKTIEKNGHEITVNTFEVIDFTDFNIPFDFTANTATYTRNVAGNEWGTVCVPFTLKSTANIQLYEFGNIAGDVLTVNEIETAEPGTPVVFANTTKGTSVTFTTENASVSATAPTTTGTLIGTYTEQNITSGLESIYFINGDKFHQAKASLTVPAYRAYIKNTSAGVKAAVLNIVVDGEATAIEGAVISDLNTTEAIYDVNGRQLSAPQKGINIMKLANGKTVKLIIK